MHSLLVLYDYIGNYITQNMVAKTGPTVVETGTSILLARRNIFTKYFSKENELLWTITIKEIKIVKKIVQ